MSAGGGGDSTRKMPPGQIIPIDLQQKVVKNTGHTTRRMAVDHVLPIPGAQRPLEKSASGERLWDLSSSEERSSSGERRSRIPQRVGEIELRKELARGGMGVVYEGFHPALRRAVAVKLLRAGAEASDEDVQRFRLEAKAVARLCHPNIVGLHQVGEEKGVHYIVMDLVQGDTLHHRLERFGAFPPPTAARIVRDLALALEHAHGEGVLHRDVKPANVLLTKDGRPLLTDFGLAKVEDSQLVLTLTGEVVGTPAFMSPEQARGLEIDERTDVYALGCVLYQALTGQVPFPGESPVDVMNAVVNDTPPRPGTLAADVPAELDAICWRCLSKDPAKRPQSATELAAELSGFLTEEDSDPAAQGSDRLRLLAVGVAVLGLVIAGLLVLTGGPTASQAPVVVRPETPASMSGPALAQERLGQAREKLDLGELEAAAALAEEALVADVSAERLLEAALVLRRANHLGRARELLDELSRVAPPAYEALLLSRELELELDPGRLSVLGPLQRVLDLSQPGEIGAWTALAQGEAKRLEGALEAAEVHYQEALELDSDMALAHLGLALVEAERREQLAALASSDRAVHLSPGLLPARLLRLELQRKTKALDVAAEGADALVASYPAVAEVWVARARVRLDQGMRAEAREDASRAVALDPELGDGYAIRARAAVAAQSFEQAAEDFTRAIERSAPDSRRLAELLSVRGFVLVQLRRPDEGRRDLERALSLLTPDDRLTRSVEVMLRRLNSRRE